VAGQVDPTLGEVLEAGFAKARQGAVQRRLAQQAGDSPPGSRKSRSRGPPRGRDEVGADAMLQRCRGPTRGGQCQGRGEQLPPVEGAEARRKAPEDSTPAAPARKDSRGGCRMDRHQVHAPEARAGRLAHPGGQGSGHRGIERVTGPRGPGGPTGRPPDATSSRRRSAVCRPGAAATGCLAPCPPWRRPRQTHRGSSLRRD